VYTQIAGFIEVVRTVIRFRKNPMNLCTVDIEERQCGVGVSVNTTILFETLQVVGFAEDVRTVIRFQKKNMN
jgi:hypothetical protein